MAKQPERLVDDIPVRIPIPRNILEITDEEQRRSVLKAFWLSYGYSDRFTVERIEDGQFIMVRKS
ncbi:MULTISPECIES: hypothetical protein [Brevibacillus]|uniref:hypothetical protein n=1 Tax=Brevibacillus TaxID=55080 RepID=UPI0004F2B15A|nr:hypothetical protein [Brevibacillus borstelensis]KKX53266.1 hypothetical protein X546_20530 [Brevibacillus borstelensis cifa_chp40]